MYLEIYRGKNVYLVRLLVEEAEGEIALQAQLKYRVVVVVVVVDMQGKLFQQQL